MIIEKSIIWKNIKTFFDKYSFLLYSFLLFSSRLPPIYIGFIKSSFLSSYNLARYIIALLFIFIFLFKKIRLKGNKIILIISLYLISQTLSITGAINIQEFLLEYKNAITGILFFIVSLSLINSKAKINTLLKIILTITIINVFFQFFVYFFLLNNRAFFDTIFYGKYLDSLIVQANRGRFFLDMYEAAIIPLILFFYNKQKKIVGKFFYILLITLIVVLTLLSNFRFQFLIMVISFFSTILLFLKKKSSLIFLTLIVLLVLIPSINLSRLETGYDILQRLVLANSQDVETITVRLSFWQKAIEMGLSSPFVGIGLGNYYDFYSPRQTISSSLFNPKNELLRATLTHPHNIFFDHFATSGFFGLIMFMILIGSFFLYDVKFLLSNKLVPTLTHCLIISFWSLFIFSQSGIDTVIQYQVLFWLLRALIIKTRFQNIP